MTGRELQTGENYYSVLLEESGKLVRHDYSREAWQGPPPGAFSFWMGKIAAPEGRKKPLIDEEMLLDCFQQLDGQTEPGRIRFRYVLALLLMRRRRFRFDEGAQQESGQEVLVLRCGRSGTQHRVINPALTEEETASVQEEVFRALGWE